MFWAVYACNISIVDMVLSCTFGKQAAKEKEHYVRRE
jgi:hypothetical protein